MLNTNPFNIFFIVISGIIIVFLILFLFFMYRRKNPYRKILTASFITGIISIITYCGYLLFTEYNYAMGFYSLYLIVTNWMQLSILVFAIEYTGVAKEYKSIFIIVLAVLCSIDSFSLISNVWTNHLFFLHTEQGYNGYLYNRQVFRLFDGFFMFKGPTIDIGQHLLVILYKFLEVLHMVLSYLMITISFVLFLVKTISSPTLYKTRYRGILYAFLIVILNEILFVVVFIPFDYIIIFYTILAAFISNYSTFSVPTTLYNKALFTINESISDSLMYFDINGEFTFANKSAKEIFSDKGVFNITKVESYHAQLMRILGENDSLIFTDKMTLAGKLYHFEVEIHKEYHKSYEVGSYLKFVDKTETINLYEKEKFEALHDELTGIFNRQGFIEAVDKDIKKKGIKDRILLVSNIKDFKLINELFGDKAGDEVLKKEALILNQKKDDGCIVGRIGDDKFALYCYKDFCDEEDLNRFASNIQQITESNVYRMHVYIGYYDPDGRNESALSMIDKATMAIKEISDTNEYKKSISYYDSTLMEKILNEKNIVQDFEHALDTNQILMYLQPIIDTKTNSFGAEALCRWQHPLRGLIYPLEFIPILEKNGLIFQLDEFIWKSAAKKLEEWAKKGCSDCYISVNVSVKDFFYTDIYKTFSRLVEDYDINPSSLHIEITELVLMSDFEKASELAEKLQKAGFVVAIDNFGNGYSSLNMLKDFKADILKMDMVFLKDADSQGKNKIILETIINMANSLKMDIVGEGVENKEQYDTLRQLNCQIYQGNYLSEPLTIEDYEDKFVKFFFKEEGLN
ncbi:MAG: EAL domain-containing protein [Treponema sp.]|nr:EAL domain-containing protein [Treponema sp.]